MLPSSAPVRAEPLSRRLKHALRHYMLALFVLAALVDVVGFVRKMFVVGIHNDFASYLAYAHLGMTAGWSHFYDLEAARSASAWAGAPWWPNQYPPSTMWLFIPLLYIPYPLAYGLWVALMTMALLAAWRIAAPPENRRLHLLAMLGLLPVGFSLWLGQVVALVALGLVVSWWLLRQHRDFLAGVALSLVILKPNLAVLVPLALLINGRWRAVAGFGAVCVPVLIVSVLLLTPPVAVDYLQHLRTVSAVQPKDLTVPDLTLVGYLGVGPRLVVADVAVVAALALLARRWRRGDPEPVLVAGVLASMLVATYLHTQDLTLLVVIAWLWLRSVSVSLASGLFLVVGWLLAQGGLYVPLFEIVWLGVLLLPALRTAPGVAVVRTFSPAPEAPRP